MEAKDDGIRERAEAWGDSDCPHDDGCAPKEAFKELKRALAEVRK